MLLVGTTQTSEEDNMTVSYNDNRLVYEGRIDFCNEKGPCFVYPCSNVRLRFKGTSVKVRIINHHACYNNYIGVMVDGIVKKICIFNEDSSLETAHSTAGEYDIYSVCEGLENTEHQLMLYKAMDNAHTFNFGGFILNDGAEVYEAEPLPEKKLEFYGDSVTAGEVSEATEYCGLADPPHKGEYSNSYWSYAWYTARKMNAQIHDIAQGGIALLDDTGWFDGPNFKGIFNMYDRIQFHLQLGETKRFDFNSYMPDAVIIAIGQNDANPEDFMANDYYGEKASFWRANYKYFVELIRRRRPEAHIVLTTTILNHNEAWDKAIDEVCNDMRKKDDKVYHFLYSNNGCGTHGHIRKPEAEKMAEELSAYLRSIGI